MKIVKALRTTFAVALLLVNSVAIAQVYSWKDSTTGASKFANIAPPWYSPGETVSGTRVIVTLGNKIVDDTALPYEDRLLLSGKSKDYIAKLRLQRQQETLAPQNPARESQAEVYVAREKRSAHTDSGTAQSSSKKGS